MGSVVGVDACTWRSHVTGGRNLIPTEHGKWQKGEPMEKVKNYKYLGVTLTRDLTWSDHIRHITAKSRKLVWLLAIYTDSSTNAPIQQPYQDSPYHYNETSS